MSRSGTTRSRTEKGRSTAVPPPVAPAPVVVSNDIIAGRLTEAEWLTMLDLEDGEMYVRDLLEELLECTMEECHKIYIQRQLIPFTVSQAKEALLNVIECRFLARDEGQLSVECDPSWQEDLEPQPCSIDTWAQGSVPITDSAPSGLTSRTAPEPELFPKEPEVDLEEEQVDSVQIDSPKEADQLKLIMALEDTIASAQTFENQVVVRTPSPPIKKLEKPKRSKVKFKPHIGPLNTNSFIDLTKSLQETEKELAQKELKSKILHNQSQPQPMPKHMALLPATFQNLLKIQAGRVQTGENNGGSLQFSNSAAFGEFDEYGRLVAVSKIDPAHIPSRRVCPKIHVAETQQDTPHRLANQPLRKDKDSQKPHLRADAATAASHMAVDTFFIESKRGQLSLHPMARLHSSRLWQGAQGTKALRVKPILPSLPPSLPRSKQLDVHKLKPAEAVVTSSFERLEMEEVLPFTPSVLNQIQPSPGVVVREGNHIKSGTLHHQPESEHTNTLTFHSTLRPVLPSVPRPYITVDQLIQNAELQIHPLPVNPE
ncbi:uncharacterized protein C2orf81 homolog [Lethenteron reissneri]|uniref:uncharacterized protein C2orf81 homolog n=1 Tax=Lethenteron reissneri TaxID=7753 RepID=UPI002AB7A3BC|nr:uncharacterized protein C2orf81 homolog [Lethenteron reissneri]XP_061408942.1 uncharacterized protein C2orf81 homolog [Lethenteron reissneri]XP_061408943.1 uncharacterized protein C2orf81 homolog [Lethenteron reissneri]